MFVSRQTVVAIKIVTLLYYCAYGDLYKITIGVKMFLIRWCKYFTSTLIN